MSLFQQPAQGDGASSQPYKPRVLCVDDEPEILNALKRQLRRDFVLVMESSPEDALDTLKEQKFDVIVSDEIMPGIRGHEFLKQSRELAPDAVRILLTGYADNDALEAAVNESAIYRYIQKPWSGADLMSAINTAVSRLRERSADRRKQEEIVEQNERLALDNQKLSVNAAKQSTTTNGTEVRRESAIAVAARVLTRILDWHDPELARHCYRVGNLAMAIGDRLGLPDEEIKVFHWAAALHDIGRLNGHKQNDTSNRFNHALEGEKLVIEIAGLEPTSPSIRHQHERFGGGGFPDGLTGEEIPIGARVVAVADAFDTHQSAGTDPGGVPVEESLAHVADLTPEYFDPLVVEALSRHFLDGI